MGAENSKVDANSIELNLLKLIGRLKTDTKIEKNVAHQIRTALKIYSERAQQFKGDKNSRSKKKTILKLIEDSNNSIDALNTFEDKTISNYGNKETNRQNQARECESRIKDVKEKLKSKEIQSSVYEQLLKMLLHCSTQLIGNKPKQKVLKGEISVLILELFIKSSKETPSANSQKDIYKKSASPEPIEQKQVKDSNRRHLPKTNVGPQKVAAPMKTDVHQKKLLTNKQKMNENFIRLTTLYENYLENIDETDVVKQKKVEETLKSFESLLENVTGTRGKHAKASALSSELQTKPKKEIEETTWYSAEDLTSGSLEFQTKASQVEKRQKNYTDDPGERKQKRPRSTLKHTPSEEDIIFQQIREDLSDCEEKARQFSFPTRSQEYQQQKTKINNLLMNLDKGQTLTQKSMTEKYSIKNRIVEALKILENNAKRKDHQEECLKDLHNFENEVDSIMKSEHLSYQDRRHKLEICKKQINSMKTSDEEVCAKKTEIISRIQGYHNNLLLAECEGHLLQCQSIFVKHKTLVHQKSPGTVDINALRKEIAALADYVQKLPSCNEIFEKKKQSLYNDMMTALSILNEKVQNQRQSLKSNIWKIQSSIDKHKSEIRQWQGISYSSTNQFYQRKRKELIELKEDVENISGNNGEKMQFKTEIHQLLNTLDKNAYASEETIPSSKPNRVQSSQNELAISLQNMKASINKYYSEAQNFKYPESSNEYQTKRSELMELFQKIQKLPEVNEKQTFKDKTKTIIGILFQKASAIEQEEEAKATREAINLQKIEASIRKYELEAQNFRYLSSTNEYQTKRSEIMELFRKIQNLPEENEKQTFKNKIETILSMLEQKASANEEAIKAAKTNLLKIQTSLDKLQHEAQNFAYPSSSKAYQRKRDEVIALQTDLSNIQGGANVNDKQSLSIRLHQVLNTLDQKALENEEVNRNLEILGEIESDISNMSKSNLEIATQIHVLNKHKERINSLDNSNNEVLLEKSALLEKIQTIEKDIKDQMGATAPQTETTTILDLEHHFDVTDLSKIDVPRQSLEFIEIVKDKAEIFEKQVKNFKNTIESVDYFVIDENLMRLTEALDKIKCHNDQPLLAKKLETLRYITELHKKLDENVIKS